MVPETSTIGYIAPTGNKTHSTIHILIPKPNSTQTPTFVAGGHGIHQTVPGPHVPRGGRYANCLAKEFLQGPE